PGPGVDQRRRVGRTREGHPPRLRRHRLRSLAHAHQTHRTCPPPRRSGLTRRSRSRKDSSVSYTIRPLDASTWAAFAELVERNNGIFGGCWCLGYHPERGQKGISRRAVKQDRVQTDRAHAALMLDENGLAQGWCQYGSPEELPAIKHK